MMKNFRTVVELAKAEILILEYPTWCGEEETKVTADSCQGNNAPEIFLGSFEQTQLVKSWEC